MTKKKYKITGVVTYEVEARNKDIATLAAMWIANGNAETMPATITVDKSIVTFKGFEVKDCEENQANHGPR